MSKVSKGVKPYYLHIGPNKAPPEAGTMGFSLLSEGMGASPA